MISKHQARKFCKDDISKIENYEQALNDATKTWDLHHRDEIRLLPSGMVAHRSKRDLIENGRYYHCPANELIFLTRSEHNNLHHKGKARSDATRHQISASKKGHLMSAETKKKMSDAHKGTIYTAEHRKNMSESLKAYWQRRKQGGNYDAKMG